MSVNHFERLGLPGRFSLSEADLERAYLAHSRAAHPDHAAGSGLSEDAASELASRVNEAYRVLRDPWRRADHLLTLRGGPSASEQKAMSPEFLEEMLDLRMEIGALAGQGDESPAKRAMLANLEARRAALSDEAAKAFDGTAEPKSIRDTLNRWKYVEGLIRDLD